MIRSERESMEIWLCMRSLKRFFVPNDNVPLVIEVCAVDGVSCDWEEVRPSSAPFFTRPNKDCLTGEPPSSASSNMFAIVLFAFLFRDDISNTTVPSYMTFRHRQPWSKE